MVVEGGFLVEGLVPLPVPLGYRYSPQMRMAGSAGRTEEFHLPKERSRELELVPLVEAGGEWGSLLAVHMAILEGASINLAVGWHIDWPLEGRE